MHVVFSSIPVQGEKRMNFPSVRRLKEDALDAFTRFPFALFSAAVATCAVLVVLENYSYGSMYQWLYNLSFVGFLGIPLFCSLQLIAERNRWMFGKAVAGKFILLALLTAYFIALPANITEANSVHIIRYFLLVVAFHLLVAVGPFLERDRLNAFWEYNKILFLRMLTAALYSGVLYAGLAIALAAVDHLFNTDIDEKRYFQLWWILGGIFNTWFFLSGIPKRLGSLDTEPRYPKGLKVFTQYVLIPLVAIYMLILYSYMGKIMMEWDWPKGWVGYLVIGFSITGIFSLLLIHPIKGQLKNRWMASIWKWFFYILLPPVVLLLLAVWRRISEYGITERRYFVIVLGLWLAAIALYFIFSRIKNIKIIPLSLCAISLIISVGPWGAFDVSERDQVNRLREVLMRNDILVNGRITKEHGKVTFSDARRISAIIRYLAEVHGFNSIQPWFTENLDTLGNSDYSGSYYRTQESSKRIAEILRVRYVNDYEEERGDSAATNYNFQVSAPYALDTKQCRYVVNNIYLNTWVDTVRFSAGEQVWHIAFQSDSSAILFESVSGNRTKFSVDLKDFSMKLCGRYDVYEHSNSNIPADSMVLSVVRPKIRVFLCFESYQVSVSPSGIKPVSAVITILMNP
jgi:hypothetical protein